MLKEVRARAENVVPRPRLVVVVDSDRTSSDHPGCEESQALAAGCQALRVPCWMLEKREAENYLPGKLLEKAPDRGPEHSRRLQAWQRLEEEQKDYFDMKNGLGPVGEADDLELFRELGTADRETLALGFGPTIHACWQLWDVPAAQEIVIRGAGDLHRGLALIWTEV